MIELWVLRLLAVLVIVAVGSRFLAPFWTLVLKGAILQKRCGCSMRMALESVSRQAAADREEIVSRRASQIIARQGGLNKWRTPCGDFWAPRFDLSLFGVLGERVADPYNLSQWGSILRDGVVLDCGAHLGGFTRQALEHGARLVVAIEPGPDQIGALRQTFADEIMEGRVIICPQGVWNSNGELAFAECGDTATAQVSGPEEPSAIRVPVTTLDTLVGALNLQQVDFIKLDIEGCEEQAMLGARSVLSRFKPHIAMAAYHHHDDSERLSKAVLQLQPAYRWSKLRCRTMEKHTHPLTLLFW